LAQVLRNPRKMGDSIWSD